MIVPSGEPVPAGGATGLDGNGDGVRVTVDLEKCLGYANCVVDAPEVFEMPDDSMVVHVLQENPPPQLRGAVESAVLDCPARAITLVED